MLGKNRYLPPVWMPFVDVRDVTEAHFLALEKGTSGDRHILSSRTMSFVELGQTFRKLFGHRGYPKIDHKRLNKCLFTGAALFSKDAKAMKPFWDIQFTCNNSKA